MSKLNHKRSRHNWSELNEELLEIIASKLMNSKLPWPDIARFRCTCSSWRVAAARFAKPGPLLLLPSEQDDSVQLGLLSVRDKTTWDPNWKTGKPKDFHMESEEVRIVGSSHGWLIMMDESSNPYLYNLFSKTRIGLPEKGRIEQLVGSKYASSYAPGYFRILIRKAILTGNPSSTQDYKVVIIHNSCRKLGLWCKGKKSWTGFSDCQNCLDVVWSDSDQTLYALGDGFKIEGWQFSGAVPTRKLSIESILSRADLSIFWSDRCTTQWYLVPSKGDILFVLRYIGEWVKPDGDLLCEAELEDGDLWSCVYRTVKFRVFKVGQKLEEVKWLKDEILFLGGNHSVSRPSVEYPGFKPNSIYFTDDYWDRVYEDYLYGGHDIGVFSLEDGSVDSVYESYFAHRIEPVPFWVLTN